MTTPIKGRGAPLIWAKQSIHGEYHPAFLVPKPFNSSSNLGEDDFMAYIIWATSNRIELVPKEWILTSLPPRRVKISQTQKTSTKPHSSSIRSVQQDGEDDTKETLIDLEASRRSRANGSKGSTSCDSFLQNAFLKSNRKRAHQGQADDSYPYPIDEIFESPASELMVEQPGRPRRNKFSNICSNHENDNNKDLPKNLSSPFPRRRRNQFDHRSFRKESGEYSSSFLATSGTVCGVQDRMQAISTKASESTILNPRTPPHVSFTPIDLSDSPDRVLIASTDDRIILSNLAERIGSSVYPDDPAGTTTIALDSCLSANQDSCFMHMQSAFARPPQSEAAIQLRNILALKVDDTSRGLKSSNKMRHGNAEASGSPTTPTLSSIAKTSECRNISNRVNYTPYQSAYMAHLVEICSTIIYDLRWSGLFSWDHGDDLSAVMTLAKFDNIKKSENDIKGTRGNVNFSLEPNLSPSQDSYEVSSIQDEANDGYCELEASALLLYCRLFVRKGPWFRLDDLLKYYVDPKSASAHENNLHKDEHNKEAGPGNIQRKFLSDPFKCLFKDVQLLLSKGLVRTFKDEHECGVIAGNQKMSGGILNLEERTLLMRLMGCGNRKKLGLKFTTRHRTPSSNISAATVSSARPQSSRKLTGLVDKTPFLEIKASNHNAVIELMKSQRPFSLTPKSNKRRGNQEKLASKNALGNEGRLLPVHLHLDKIIRSAMAAKYKEIIGCNNDTFQTLRHTHTHPLCIRLREEPLVSLRRAVRLFLIATGGPGSMRGEYWLSVFEKAVDPDTDNDVTSRITSFLALPCWGRVEYPGLLHGLKLKNFSFRFSYVSLKEKNIKNLVTNNKFAIFCRGREQFLSWEAACEVRFQVDRLIQMHEFLKMEQKRGNSYENINKQSKLIDHFEIHTFEGRKRLCKLLLMDCQLSADVLSVEVMLERFQPNLKKKNVTENDKTEFETVAQETLIYTCCVLVQVLSARLQCADPASASHAKSYPWFRHLRIEPILAYCIWDVIDLVERLRLYDVALEMLGLILGFPLVGGLISSDNLNGIQMAQYHLSRRTRGKALERMVIDYTHLCRIRKSLGSSASLPRVFHITYESHECSSKTHSTTLLCRSILENFARNSALPFSFLRGIARRLGQPLNETMDWLENDEAKLLNILLESNDLVKTNKHVETRKRRNSGTKYNEFTPKTDRSIANAINSSDVGSRCSYVGWEDDGCSHTRHRSLNVEELAMQEYKSGRLPCDHSEQHLCGGGWVGWHDEGGHIRALFRILVSDTILQVTPEGSGMKEMLFLTPYQAAPLDLHIGYQTSLNDVGKEHYGLGSFYSNRLESIELFLKKLECMNRDELATFVYESISKGAMSDTGTQDNFFKRDIQEIRTLTLIAVGMGGKVLADIFRCMFFDYRHYSGGFPDLTLIRAYFLDDAKKISDSAIELVELGNWVGEGFKKYAGQEARESKSLLMGRDDEFLGCSKSDSAGLSKHTSPSNIRALGQAKEKICSLPPPLCFHQEGREINVQCLFVEVKSHNDKLDRRQEDWLNILSRNGNARLCKFEKSNTKAI